jgi:hypothetical protein
MYSTVTNLVGKRFWNVVALSLAFALVGGVCVPGLAQLDTRKDASFLKLNSSVPVANMAGLSTSASKSATGLSSLPIDARGSISAALGNDDSGYWFHRSAEGLSEENPRQALVAVFTREGAEVRSQNLSWQLETRGYGYGDAVHEVNAVSPQAKANRVE